MKRLKRYFEHRAVAVFFIAALVIAAVDLLRKSSALEANELHAYDRLLQTRTPSLDYKSPIVLVTINESDLRRFGYPISDTRGGISKPLEILNDRLETF